ncbi:hypothetical protein LguiA_000104 [Lonicera macranthoides]
MPLVYISFEETCRQIPQRKSGAMLVSVPTLTLLLHEFRCIKCSECAFNKSKRSSTRSAKQVIVAHTLANHSGRVVG